jgi:hypothetical protein
MRRPRVLAALAALATTLACAGCGFGPGIGSGAVRLRVTENFGATTLKSTPAKITGAETDMQLLQRHATVATRYGGGYVESIDGHSGTGQHRDWFYYVNGIQATKGAAATKVDKGDNVWFDLHDWQASGAAGVPAVVGSFPEPFQDGIGGRRYPSTISCSGGADGPLKASCDEITAQFTRLHIPLSPATPGYGANDVLSINVGTWQQLYGEVAAELVKYGPGTSGVYAHFADGGHQLDLENAAGTVVRRLGPDSGLIAAIANSANDPAPTWLVTGTDRAGVQAAARMFNTRDLADHFALAVHGATLYPVPLTGSS